MNNVCVLLFISNSSNYLISYFVILLIGLLLYYNDDKYLSAVGIGSSFVSITGMNIVYVNNFNHDENKSRTKY